MFDIFHSKKRCRSLSKRRKVFNKNINNEIKQYIRLRQEFHSKKETLTDVWLNL